MTEIASFNRTNQTDQFSQLSIPIESELNHLMQYLNGVYEEHATPKDEAAIKALFTQMASKKSDLNKTETILDK